MDVLDRIFANSQDSLFFVFRGPCYDIILTRDCVDLFCFLRKLWVWEKTHLNTVKPWEMKNLPWDHKKCNETVWHTVKPWELRGLCKWVHFLAILQDGAYNFTKNIFLQMILKNFVELWVISIKHLLWIRYFTAFCNPLKLTKTL